MPTKKAPEMVADLPKEKEEHQALYEAARKVLLAGIGAVALAEDELEDFVKRLVDRGEIAEKDGRKLLRETRDKLEQRRKEVLKTEEKLSSQVEATVNKMSLSSKSDIETLTEKIDALTKKIDNLKKPEAAKKSEAPKVPEAV